MNKEYIEREALFAAVKEKSMTQFDWSEKVDLEEFEEVLNHIPNADVVEVVKCKNCKHSIPIDRTKSPFKYYKESCIMCTCEDVVGDEPMVYLPNHFCSYGETNG